jgi:hypothetical protein
MLGTYLAAICRQRKVCFKQLGIFLEQLPQIWAADLLLTL